MSIQDREAAEVYEYFKGDAVVVQNTKAQGVAELIDDLAEEGAVLEMYKEAMGM